MSTIVNRTTKGSPLTNNEVDDNFTNLNTDKMEKGSNLSDISNAATARSILGSRETLDSTTIPSATKHKVVYVSSFEAGDATGAVKEAGIFNSGTAAAGDMLSRTTFAVVNKAADDTMAVTWTITLSAT